MYQTIFKHETEDGLKTQNRYLVTYKQNRPTRKSICYSVLPQNQTHCVQRGRY